MDKETKLSLLRQLQSLFPKVATRNLNQFLDKAIAEQRVDFTVHGHPVRLNLQTGTVRWL